MADVDINALIEKATNQDATIKEYEVKVKDYDTKIADLTKTIEERDNQISKLQSLLANNLIASKEQPINDVSTPKDFKTIYAEMIKKNTTENKKE